MCILFASILAFYFNLYEVNSDSRIELTSSHYCSFLQQRAAQTFEEMDFEDFMHDIERPL